MCPFAFLGVNAGVNAMQPRCPHLPFLILISFSAFQHLRFSVGVSVSSSMLGKEEVEEQGLGAPLGCAYRDRVSIQVGADLPQVQQLRLGQEASFGPDSIQDGGCVAL